MASHPFVESVRFGFSRVFRVKAFLGIRFFVPASPISRQTHANDAALPIYHAPFGLPSCRGPLPFPCAVRRLCGPVAAQALTGSAPHSPVVAASFTATLSNAFLRGRLARRKALPVSGGADVDPFGNVYFSRRVLTHVRLPLRILPRVLRRFARPRSTARNPRKDAPRL